MNAPAIIARWPEMMKRKTAADYVDMSVPSFVNEVAAGRFPGGVIVGGTMHWHKGALDKALARIAGEIDDGDEISQTLRKRYG